VAKHRATSERECRHSLREVSVRSTIRKREEERPSRNCQKSDGRRGDEPARGNPVYDDGNSNLGLVRSKSVKKEKTANDL